MHKLTVTLKQHTPLIHFQHDQEGATLRASEVKPKLDRFLLSKLSDEEKNEGKKDGWIKEKEGKCWLDYKVKIKSTKRKENIVLTVVQERGKYFTRISNQSRDEFPFLLCNMGGKENEEELMNLAFYEENELTLLIASDSLCKLLITHVPAVFATSNFGQRITKGFGSFSVVSMKHNDNDVAICHFSQMLPDKTPIIKFNLSGNDFEKQLMLFQTLDFYWKCLKSGINYSKRVQDRNTNGVKLLNPERYIKPYLWTYLNGVKSKTWEKRLIKDTFPQLQTQIPRRTFAKNSNTPIFARGMMGCPMFFEYKVPNGTFSQNAKGKLIENKDEYRVNISNENMERISSPIIFKPIISGDVVSVYVLFDRDVIVAAENENSKTFTFTCEQKKGNRYVSMEGGLTIDISPSSIDYLQLIQSFHYFIGTDKEMSKSIFCNTKLTEDQKRFKMIPRDFQWNNILGGNNMISFYQVKKQ